jgi:glycosyltransferase involved in cell wall biosynthesis
MMKIYPKVSIITPSFNQALYLEETILSVINQDYKNIEYIVIDGSSNDGSVEILKKYEKYISYWVSEKDNGQADAINKGFAKATGDYICWVNSDDVLYPRFVSTRVDQFVKNNHISMIYGDVDQGWNTNNKAKRRGAQQQWVDMITSCIVRVPQMSAVWKREVYCILGGLDCSMNVLLDWEYFVRIAEKFVILYCPGSLAFFRQHNNSKSVNMSSNWADEMLQYYEKNIFSSIDKRSINQKNTRQNLYLICSSLYKGSKDETKSVKLCKEAKDISPVRFYKIYLFRGFLNFLVRLKKKMKALL